MKVTTTQRGFQIAHFEDSTGIKCSIQEASNVDPRLWLGVHDATAMVMSKDAAKVGVVTDRTTGWVAYPLPPEVLVPTRMLLTKQRARELAAMLLKWADTETL